MKRLMGVVVVLVVLLAGCAPPRNTPGALGGGPGVDGFRGWRWGTPLEEFKRGREVVQLHTSPDGTAQYTIKGDNLSIGGATLSDIHYFFWNDELISVAINADGLTNFYALKEASFQKFGRGLMPNQYIEEYLFPDRLSNISLKYNKITRTSLLLIVSWEYSNRIQAAAKEKARQGVKDF